MKNLIPHLRRKKNIKQYDLAKSLGVSPSYLCKIEKGLAEPTKTFIARCTRYFNTPFQEIFIDEEKDCIGSDLTKKFTNRLWSARKEKGMKQYTLAEMIGCSPSYLSKVEKGLQEPNRKFRRKCAKILKMKEIFLFPL